MEVSVVTRDPVSVLITDPSQVGEARRLAVAIADALAFNDTLRGEVAIVVTELGTNLLRHAGGGEIVARSLPASAGGGMEVLALDRGPGIANVAQAMSDGYSTGSTPGNGLGAVRRLSATFDLFTSPNEGTALLARFGTAAVADRLGVVCLPKPGETACGDAFDAIDLGEGRSKIMVVDGLGHGVRAAEAAHRAVQIFRANPAVELPRLLDLLHAGLRATRGAAVSVVDVRRREGELRYVGVGNITARLFIDGKARGMVNQNGTVGAELRRVQEFAYPFPPDAVLVLHSDGLTSQWQLEKYVGLARRHPTLIAGVLYRDFRRERDDVTVLTAIGGMS